MSVTARVDDTVIKNKLRAFRARRGLSLRRATVELGYDGAVAMNQMAPRDTNRFVRGIQVAHNQIAAAEGLPSLPVSPVQPTRRQDEIEARLYRQILRVEKRLGQLHNYVKRDQARPDFNSAWPSHQKLINFWIPRTEKLLKRSIKEHKKFLELNEFERSTAIVIGGRGRAPGGAPETARQLQTFRAKVYGGTGRVFEVGGKAFYELRNREPHARIVEKRWRVAARAAAGLRGLGLRRASNAYLKTLGPSVTGRSAA